METVGKRYGGISVLRNRTRRSWSWLRRGAALGMAVSAVWIISLTTVLPGPGDVLAVLGASPQFTVETLSSQVGWKQWQGTQDAIGPWGRLFLDQSAALLGGAELLSNTEDSDVESQQVEVPKTEVPEELPQKTVVEHTGTGQTGGKYLWAEKVCIQNSTGQSIDVTALAEQTLNLEMGEGPQILIYHTHGSEAYTQTEENRYIESDSYRTIDCERNVVRVGEEMAQVFRTQGFEVIHDTTLYDYPAYSGAYERSRAGVEGWLAQYPSIQFILDVHRDALISQDGAAYKLVAQEGEQKVAQVMFVVGSSDGSTDHPNWRKNLGLAIHLQSALTQRYEQLARPITLRSSRFNQHLSTGSLLVEVGGHGNTLEEAVEGGKLFARTVGAALKDMR